MTIDHETSYWQTAAAVCTPREFEALQLRNLRNLGTRRIALILGITPRSRPTPVTQRNSNGGRGNLRTPQDRRLTPAVSKYPSGFVGFGS